MVNKKRHSKMFAPLGHTTGLSSRNIIQPLQNFLHLGVVSVAEPVSNIEPSLCPKRYYGGTARPTIMGIVRNLEMIRMIFSSLKKKIIDQSWLGNIGISILAPCLALVHTVPIECK